MTPRRPRSAVAAAALWLVPIALVVATGCTDDSPTDGRAGDGSAQGTYVVVFRSWPDLDVPAADWASQGAELVERLRTNATEEQARARRAALGAGATWTELWIANSAVMTGPASLADDLEARSEVASVDRVSERPTAHDATLQPVAAGTVASPTPNIVAIGAQTAWSAGRTAAGMVVGVIDTGVDATHPALAPGFRTVDGWFDAVGGCTAAPCDRVGHGTMVAGLAVGRSVGGTPAIGVAPDATWITARACDDDGCRVDALLAAAQWMLAPTAVGDPGTPDPAARPHVINNSWGLDRPDRALDRAVQAWRAAGIVPVFAAGNGGPACDTVTDPASRADVVAVGAVNDLGQPMELSARGSDSRRPTEPDLVAPGAAVTSTAPGGGYASGDGTSFAAPQVAGAAALLRATLPDPTASGSADQVVDRLRSTARKLDGPDPCGTGTVTGAGMLDLGTDPTA